MTNALRSTRLLRAQEALAAVNADWLLAPASPDFRWLTGASGRVTERIVALLLPRSGDPFVVAPRLEAGPLREALGDLDMLVWDEHEDPVARLAERAKLTPDTTLLVGDGLHAHQVLRLASLAKCRAASDVLAPLRAVKDADELAQLAEAARHADQVVEETADWAKPGMTERQVARFIAERFEALGDTDVWSIVGGGPNSANPHHDTSNRVIAAGEVLLLDLGAVTNGYGSDITRTYFLGTPPKDVAHAYEVVDAARAAGIAAVRAGIAAEDVDRAARAVIEAAGLGEAFVHRTGHGLGLEIHEPPYLVKGNRAPLVAGNVHSVEPGVYFPGKFGIRIEDIVVVEANGARNLQHAPRDLRPPKARA